MVVSVFFFCGESSIDLTGDLEDWFFVFFNNGKDLERVIVEAEWRFIFAGNTEPFFPLGEVLIQKQVPGCDGEGFIDRFGIGLLFYHRFWFGELWCRRRLFGFGGFLSLSSFPEFGEAVVHGGFQGELDVRHVLFLIEVGIDLGLGDFFGLHAAFGNFHAGDPDDGVEDHFAVAVDDPVAVVVATGEAAAAGAVGFFKSPDEVLWFAVILGGVVVPKIGARDHVLLGGNARDERDGVFVEAE